MKVVSQLNSAGYFVAPAFADPSPLEPGVYLLPGGCVDVEPPTIPFGKIAKWDYDKSNWEFIDNPANQIPDKPLVPMTVTMRQARLALLKAGKLSMVASVIDSLPSPDKEYVQIEWEYSQTVERNRPYVIQLGEALGLSEEELDNLFIEAIKL